MIGTAAVGHHAPGKRRDLRATPPRSRGGSSSQQRTVPRSVFRSLWIGAASSRKRWRSTQSSSGREAVQSVRGLCERLRGLLQLLLHLLGVRLAAEPLGVDLPRLRGLNVLTSFGPKAPSPGSASRSARRASSRRSIQANVAPSGVPAHPTGGSVVVVVDELVVDDPRVSMPQTPVPSQTSSVQGSPSAVQRRIHGEWRAGRWLARALPALFDRAGLPEQPSPGVVPPSSQVSPPATTPSPPTRPRRRSSTGSRRPRPGSLAVADLEVRDHAQYRLAIAALPVVLSMRKYTTVALGA